MCHYCGASVRITGRCPACGGESLFTETPGTQKVEQELHEKFPAARVLRMDADTMHTKGAHEKLLAQFAKGEADILLGTQMVTKGLDFENVTLVGVLDADQSLYAQDYRARERTFSLLTQVVGRAGRRQTQGQAIIQTYHPQDEVILDAARQDYERFYEAEIERRRMLQCPPIAQLVVLTAVGECERDVLAALVAVTIVLSIRIMGIVLLISLLTMPVAIVNALSKSYRTIALCAPLVAVAGNVAGLVASYNFEVPPGAAIIFTLSLTLIIVKLLPLRQKKAGAAA